MVARTALALFAAASAALAAAAGPVAAGELARITILHTNDLHGQVRPLKAVWSRRDDAPLLGGFSALASMIESLRSKARAEGDGVLLLDAGDCWQGTPEGNLTEGRIVV